MILLRDFANFSEQEMLRWFIPRRYETVVDDNKQKLKTDTYILASSWYGLSIHRDHNEFPYHIDEIINSDIIEDDANAEPINNFLQRLMPIKDCPVETDHIKQRIYEWQIKLNNFFTMLGQGGEVSASALDVEEIMSHDEIVEIKEQLRTNQITNSEGEAQFKEVILRSKTVPQNSFTMLARTGGVSVNQGFQTMGERGSVFDLNNRILPNDIKQSFAEGIVNRADALGENRGAGKALTSNGKALEDSEWFHRKLHISTAVILGIDFLNDCGTERLVPIKITNPVMSKAFIGKFIEHEGEITLMTRELAKLYKRGDVVRMRSTSFCEYHEDGKFCGVCYGKLKASLPYNVIMLKSANPGLYSATEIAERIGQALLSTKHFMRHTTAIPFVVRPQHADVINTDGDNIFVNDTLKDSKLKLTLDAINASDLTDLKGLDSLDDISEDQLKTFDSVSFTYAVPDPMIDGETQYDRVISTSVSSRSSRMSRELIEYAIEHGWERQKKRMIIDLSEWDYTKPLFFLPYVHEDLNQYRQENESFLSFKNRNDIWMRREITEDIFGEVLGEFWTLINHKFSGINIVHPEIILTALLAQNPAGGSYGLPVGQQPRYFASFTRCIENRGMGGLYIYQGQHAVLERVATYGVKNRPRSLMEADLAAAVL